ncbi:MAG: methyltransferase domain-containing protein, partial [Flavobacteriales bacterium]
MPTEATVYRVLIASPSDVQEERKAARDVVIKWNGANSRKEDVYLEPVMWESHVAPNLGDDPQNIINEQIIEDIDLVIGMFWKRIGTKTENEAGGAVEEIKKVASEKSNAIVGFSQKPEADGELSDFTQKKNDEKSTYDLSVDKERLEKQVELFLDYKLDCISEIVSYLQNQDVDTPYKVLDAGCGNGKLTRECFGDNSKFDVKAVDVDEQSIRIARKHFPSNNIDYEVADVNEINIDDFPDFEIVYSGAVLHHLKNQETVLSKLWRLISDEAGAYMVASPDDGTFVHYPPDEELEWLIEVSEKIKGQSDRAHGRRLYTQLKRLKPTPKQVEVKLQEVNTANRNSNEREFFFDVMHSWRKNAAKRLAQKAD